MSTNAVGFDFTQFIPGFSFLKEMAQPQGVSPAMSQWIAPTLDPQETGKRIQELKTVLFWLEQNATALKATIQALEVQQLTCQTLQDMNAGVADWAQKMQEAVVSATAVAAQPIEEKTSAAEEDSRAASIEAQAASDAALHSAIEQAGQWWGSLLQTFGQIASQAQEEVAQRQEEFMQAQQAFAESTEKAMPAAVKSPARKPAAGAARKTGAAKPTAAKKAAATKPASATKARAASTRKPGGLASR